MTAILNELVEHLDVEVVFVSGRVPATALNSWATFRDPWGSKPRFPYSFVPSAALYSTRTDFHAQVALGTSLLVARSQPDVVLVHGWGLPMVEPIVWARGMRRPALMWSESTLVSGLHRGRLADAYRRLFVASIQAFVASGSRATEYLRILGVPNGRIITSCLPAVATASSADEERLESDGVDAGRSPRFLFVGRLIPRKRPLDAVHAFGRVRARFPNALLTVAGDGPLLRSVKRAAADTGGVNVVGRLEGRELLRQYRRADILVAPFEREVWGLVVNEALQAGLYVVASDQVASAADLLRADTGVIVPTGGIDALAAAMRTAGEHADLSREGRAFRATSVAHCNPRAFALAIQRAVYLTGTGG